MKNTIYDGGLFLYCVGSPIDAHVEFGPEAEVYESHCIRSTTE